VNPRAGVALALAAPIFPLGNLSASAAVVYGIFASGWLALTWRDARHGLLFVSGPLLAGLGLLPLVPLVAQRAHGSVRRAAQGAVAVLAATFVAANHTALGIGPLSTIEDTARVASGEMLGSTSVTLAVMGIAAATALLPILRERLPYGVAAIGFVLTAGSVVGGASVASTFLVVCVWASAAVWALLPRRS
jgi:hypothetical protein